MSPGNIHPKSPLNGHPLAQTFPMMDQGQMAAHIESIREHGQKTAIVLFDGMVADGRNTLFACLEAGRAPIFRNFGDDPADGDSLAAYVITHNLHRRHMNPSQRAAAAVEMVPFFEEEAAQRMKAGQFKKAATAPVPQPQEAPVIQSEERQPQPENVLDFPPIATAPPPETVVEPAPAPKPSKKGSAVSAAADVFKVSPTMVKLGKRLKKNHPALYEEVLNGSKTIHAAETEAAAIEKAAKESISVKAQRTERLQAIKHLEQQHGEKTAFMDGVRKKTILKKHADLLKFADMPKKKAFTILPLVKMGWSPDKAASYIDARATEDTTVQDLIAMAILSTGADDNAEITRAYVVGAFTITLHREGKEEEVNTALNATADATEKEAKAE